MFVSAFQLARIGQEACVHILLREAEVNFKLERTKATQSVALALTDSGFLKKRYRSRTGSAAIGKLLTPCPSDGLMGGWTGLDGYIAYG